MVHAIPEAIAHRRAFEEFDACLQKDKSTQVDRWAEIYAKWDKKSTSSPCIFDTTEPSTSPAVSPHPLLTLSIDVTMASVKLALANEEAAKIGLTTTAIHTVTTFVTLALDIEHVQ